MLITVSTLLGSSVLASDGEIGVIRDVLFHDDSWVVHYLVVDTGEWLAGRQVLISPYVALPPELQTRVLKVNLTREQVQSSPGVDKDLPVSRQHEIAMSQHYGWPAYWELHEDRNAPVRQGDPALRSVNEVLRYSVKTADGDLGHVTDLIVEDVNWFIRFLVVNTGTWFEGQRLLLATRWVGAISWQDREVLFPHSRDTL